MSEHAAGGGLVGAESAMRLLESARARGEVAHAYLFAGPEGVGKRQGALRFAQALLCEGASPRCGACPACVSVLALRHEDLLVLHGDANPLWHDPADLARVAGLAAGDRAGLAALLERLAGHDLVARPLPGASDKRRLWPVAFGKDALGGSGESARSREQSNPLARIERLLERRVLAESEARVARQVAVPPLSLALYRRGARGLGIAAIAPRESGRGRSVKTFFEKRPSRGGRKIAIVDEAHWMTEEAQNSFLKTLEEPPPDVTLILVTHNPGALLPTIRSRVSLIPWRALSDREMSAFLESATDYDASEREILCVAAGGAPGRALRQEPEAFVRLRRIAIDLLHASAAGDLPRFLATAARLAQTRGSREEERHRVEELLDMLLLYLRDLKARALLGDAAPLRNADLREEIAADAVALAPELVRLAPSLLMDARARLATFSDPRLVLEGLFFPLFPRSETAIAGARGAGAR
jgi:DNA polymerase III delta prime subunit